MSQTIDLNNFTGNILNQVKLTNDTAAAVTALSVTNSAAFISGLPIVLGNPGSDTCELLTTTTPADSTTVTPTAATTLPHNSGEAVSILFGTSLRIYRAADQYGTGQQPDDSQFALLATTVIDPTQENTSYTDSSSGSYWYKYTFYNPTTSAETPLADSVAVQAGQTHYVSLDDIRSSAGLDDAPLITDDKIAKFRDSAEREVNGRLQAVYSLPLPQPINPIVVQIVKNIAAGELMQDVYNTISPVIAAQGADRASKARNGGGEHTSLAELVDRTVVLQDANFLELTLDEAHGFGGLPDENTADLSYTYTNDELGTTGHDRGYKFWIDKEY